jgi:hypothetical protein
MAMVVRAVRIEQGDKMILPGKTLINYDDALAQLTEDQRLRATVYAIEHTSHCEGVLYRRRI